MGPAKVAVVIRWRTVCARPIWHASGMTPDPAVASFDGTPTPMAAVAGTTKRGDASRSIGVAATPGEGDLCRRGGADVTLPVGHRSPDGVEEVVGAVVLRLVGPVIAPVAVAAIPGRRGAVDRPGPGHQMIELNQPPLVGARRQPRRHDGRAVVVALEDRGARLAGHVAVGAVQRLGPDAVGRRDVGAGVEL